MKTFNRGRLTRMVRSGKVMAREGGILLAVTYRRSGDAPVPGTVSLSEEDLGGRGGHATTDGSTIVLTSPSGKQFELVHIDARPAGAVVQPFSPGQPVKTPVGKGVWLRSWTQSGTVLHLVSVDGREVAVEKVEAE